MSIGIGRLQQRCRQNAAKHEVLKNHQGVPWLIYLYYSLPFLCLLLWGEQFWFRSSSPKVAPQSPQSRPNVVSKSPKSRPKVLQTSSESHQQVAQQSPKSRAKVTKQVVQSLPRVVQKATKSSSNVVQKSPKRRPRVIKQSPKKSSRDMVVRVANWTARCMDDGLIDWLIDWAIDWLIDRLIFGRFFNVFVIFLIFLGFGGHFWGVGGHFWDPGGNFWSLGARKGTFEDPGGSGTGLLSLLGPFWTHFGRLFGHFWANKNRCKNRLRFRSRFLWVLGAFRAHVGMFFFFLNYFEHFFGPRGSPKPKSRFSKNARNTCRFFMIFRVEVATIIQCLVPGATFSTSENRLGFLIDFWGQKCQNFVNFGSILGPKWSKIDEQLRVEIWSTKKWSKVARADPDSGQK